MIFGLIFLLFGLFLLFWGFHYFGFLVPKSNPNG